MSDNKVRITNNGYYNIELLKYDNNPNAKVLYSKLKTTTFKVPDIGYKNEIFADVPKTDGNYIISNKGRVFKKVYNKIYNNHEYLELEIRKDKFVDKEKQGKGASGNYLYCDIEVNSKKRVLWVGRTVADLFVPKPEYIIFKGGLFDSKIKLDQNKLRVYYNDNFGTNPYADNLRWTYRNDAGVKCVSEKGNGRIPKSDNGGEKYVIYDYYKGTVLSLFNNITDAGDFIGRPNCKGDMISILCKGRTPYYDMPDGTRISCRKYSTLSQDTRKEYINIFNNATEFMRRKEYDVASKSLF